VPRGCRRAGFKHASFAAVLDRHFCSSRDHRMAAPQDERLPARPLLQQREDEVPGHTFNGPRTGAVGALIRPKLAVCIERQLQGRVAHQLLEALGRFAPFFIRA